MSTPFPTRTGTWLSIGSPVIAELAAACGFDWVLLDLEHGCESEAALPNQLRALRGTKTRGIVRVGAPYPDLISRVLDWGAFGIMVPHVNSAAEAEAIVQAAHYSPRGHRGFSRTVRTYDYGLNPPGENTPVPVILAQIETVQGVAAAEEIAAVDGIDALFVGPADLGHDIKARKSTLVYEDCLRTVIEAARQQGKESGILVRQPQDFEKMRALGFSWLAIDSDLSLLREGFLKNVKAAKPS
ncbi:2-dehydro-3-deoxyglucarate aldolase/4-hydroxy-2-oxoheptanedioate aldolase [Prosthecobacter fusiformis]|uniref:2-dehydro-3-deoxyglucarate aldolase/4-hydroxy-2-oxoheptanedioate aldolase n=1 Tax=Prosthecobacter fusiformis TaxID=48464 RepID=A0A4R7RML7_9BACT|nr:aldolase/citrate lyase family protein [Prosthecobacter fusiformis]TDU66631.1 2-dehydro-3-deoxyglucarate aldolase/4-hydroxy-2-oxoheptanedioate aldolase [Prosthecobacter fusiformis]